MKGEAVSVGADSVPGHDGAAELQVRLRFENGAAGRATLAADQAFALMDACGARELSGLAGRSWRDIVKGLRTCTTS